MAFWREDIKAYHIILEWFWLVYQWDKNQSWSQQFLFYFQTLTVWPGQNSNTSTSQVQHSTHWTTCTIPSSGISWCMTNLRCKSSSQYNCTCNTKILHSSDRKIKINFQTKIFHLRLPPTQHLLMIYPLMYRATNNSQSTDVQPNLIVSPDTMSRLVKKLLSHLGNEKLLIVHESHDFWCWMKARFFQTKKLVLVCSRCQDAGR